MVARSDTEMKRFSRNIVVVCIAMIGLFVGTFLGVSLLIKTLTRLHQEGITSELADWSFEFGTIGSMTAAAEAIDMLRYINGYYVVAPGYRSNPETERRLEAQRKKTIDTIVNALQVYSGKSIGNDPNAWETWMKERNKPPR